MWDDVDEHKKTGKKTIENSEDSVNVSTDTDLEKSELEADLQLRMQRSLAQKVLEKSNVSESGSLNGSLKNSTVLSSESFLDLSSSQNSTEPNCLKHDKDKCLCNFFTTVKSGSLSNKKEMDISASSFESFKIGSSAQSTPHVFPSKLRSERFQSLGANECSQGDFQDEFVPADQLQSKLLADENSWLLKYGNLPINQLQIGKEFEISKSSNFRGNAEVTAGSVMLDCQAERKKLTTDEYFNLKSNNLGGLQNSNARPNFGTDIESPDQRREPVKLLDDSSFQDSISSVSKHNKMERPLDTTANESSSSSIISISSIQKLMSDEENLMTPRTLFKNLVNFDSKKAVAVASNDKLLHSIVVSEGRSLEQNTEDAEYSAENDSYWIGNPEASSAKRSTKAVCVLEDNLMKNADDEEWVNITVMSGDNSVMTGVGLNTQVLIAVENLTKKKIQCELKLHEINSQNKTSSDNCPLAHVNLPSRAAMLEPKSVKEAKLWFIPLVSKVIVITLSVFLEDLSTKARQHTFFKICLVAEEPEVQIAVNKVTMTQLDFGTLPENCSKHLCLSVVNLGNFDAPVRISVEKNYNLQIFSILVGARYDQEVSELETCPFVKCVLKAKDKQKCILCFHAPPLSQTAKQSGIIDLSTELRIELDVPGAENKVLKRFRLLGCVGHTDLLLMKNSIPVVLSSDNGQEVTQLFAIMNDGAVPLNLSFSIVDEHFRKIHNDVISVEPKSQLVPIKQKIAVALIYRPISKTKGVHRFLLIQIDPKGQRFKAEIYGSVKIIKEEKMQKIEDELTVQTRDPTSAHQVIGNSGSAMQGGCNDSGKLSTESTTICSTQTKSCPFSFPIAATQKELIWGSVPVGQQATESFMLRNEGNCTMKLQISLQDSSSSFKILTEQRKSVKELKIALQSMERVKFNITFEPSKPGAAYDKVTFRKYPSQEAPGKLMLPLYAYGGHHRVTIKGVPKDGTGRMWLCVGALDFEKPCMEAYFIISNSGTLDAFAFINVTSKGLEFLKKTTIAVEPHQLIISARSSATVKISYRVQKEQLKYFASAAKEISEIGVLSILTGDEPSRQRVRRVWNSMQSKKSHKSSDHFSFMDLSSICEALPEEKVLHEVELLKDPERAISMLCHSFVNQDISLTVEKSGERTFDLRSCMVSDCTESQTQLFTSLYNETVNESIDSSARAGFETGSQSSFWSISAESLVLVPPRITEGCVQIFSKSQTPQIFEAQANNKLLIVTPAEGIVPPNGEVMVTVSCPTLPKSNCKVFEAILKIYLENDVKQVRIVIKSGT